MATVVVASDSSASRANRSILLVHGYVRKFSKTLGKDTLIPDDVVTICWKHFFISFTSAIITKDKDLDTFFNLLSKKLSNERVENAKLLYRATRDAPIAVSSRRPNRGMPKFDVGFPYDKLTDKGPYLFIIQATDGYVFGGYCTTNIDETEKCTYLSDEDAFVFVLKGAKTQKPVIYSIKAGGNAATFFDGYGYFWLFGPSGADMLIYPPTWNKETKEIVKKQKSFCCVNSADQLKYNIPIKQSLIGTDSTYHFYLSEMEMYNV